MYIKCTCSCSYFEVWGRQGPIACYVCDKALVKSYRSFTFHTRERERKSKNNRCWVFLSDWQRVDGFRSKSILLLVLSWLEPHCRWTFPLNAVGVLLFVLCRCACMLHQPSELSCIALLHVLPCPAIKASRLSKNWRSTFGKLRCVENWRWEQVLRVFWYLFWVMTCHGVNSCYCNSCYFKETAVHLAMLRSTTSLGTSRPGPTRPGHVRPVHHCTLYITVHGTDPYSKMQPIKLRKFSIQPFSII